jgi:hypothetical protein
MSRSDQASAQSLLRKLFIVVTTLTALGEGTEKAAAVVLT